MSIIRLRFKDKDLMREVEETVSLSVVGASVLYGEPMVRLGFSYALSHDKGTVVLRYDNVAGECATLLTVGFGAQEFGKDSFAIERVEPKDEGKEA